MKYSEITLRAVSRFSQESCEDSKFIYLVFVLWRRMCEGGKHIEESSNTFVYAVIILFYIKVFLYCLLPVWTFGFYRCLPVHVIGPLYPHRRYK